MEEEFTTNVLEFFLPENTLKWFDVVKGERTKSEIKILLEEKNNPPLKPEYINNKVKSKGFTNITVNDFSIRGRSTKLTFRRRYWKVAGERGLLKRDIKLVSDGTQLEKEFADFLKERGGRIRRFIKRYCKKQ